MSRRAPFTTYGPLVDVALLFGLLLAYLAGNGSVPLFDRDEPRYAVTSRAMLETGDYVVPRFLDEVRTAKPPAVYWLQAAAMAVVGVDEFAVRLPGALACVAAVAILRYGAAGVVGRRRARWAAFILGTSTLTLGVAKVGVTDGPLLACAATMFVGLLHVQRGRRWAWWAWWAWLIVWLAVGVGGLLKGPVLLGVLATTVIAWTLLEWIARRNKRPGAEAEASDSGAIMPGNPKLPIRRRGLLRNLHPLAGLAIALLVCLPWLILIQLREPTFLSTTLWHDLFARSTRGLEGHGQPPGFHTLLLPATFFPWSILLPGALVVMWRRPFLRGWMRLALAAFVGPLVMFELVATKLPHYLLPTFPALSMIVADWVVRASAGRLKLDSRGLTLGGAIFGVVFVGFGIAGMILASPRAAWPVAVLAVGAAVVAFRTWHRAAVRAGTQTVGVAWALLVAATFSTWLGNFAPLTLSPRIAASAADLGVARAAMVEHKEPSLAWSAGQLGIVVREAEPVAFAEDDWPWIITTRKAFDRLPATVAERWVVAASVTERNYNEGLSAREVLIVRRQSVGSQTGAR